VLIDPFPYPGSDRIVTASHDKSGTDRFAGPSGHKQTSFARRNRSKDVTLMDWWNLTTTDGDSRRRAGMYIDPNAPNHWGIRALMGRWLIPSDAHRDKRHSPSWC